VTGSCVDRGSQITPCGSSANSTLAWKVERGLDPECSGLGADKCGVTSYRAMSVDVDVDAHFNSSTCAFDFAVSATGTLNSSLCSFSPVNTTPENFCLMATLAWNGGHAGGGACFDNGGQLTGNTSCVRAHEDGHVADFQSNLTKELSPLLAQQSMQPLRASPGIQSCDDAVAARYVAIYAATLGSYNSAAAASSGEATAEAAEADCEAGYARTTCQWAQDAADVDVDQCPVCTMGALGTVYTDP